MSPMKTKLNLFRFFIVFSNKLKFILVSIEPIYIMTEWSILKSFIFFDFELIRLESTPFDMI